MSSVYSTTIEPRMGALKEFRTHHSMGLAGATLAGSYTRILLSSADQSCLFHLPRK